MSVKNMTAEELRTYIQGHHEKSYRLVDVRQPGEYAFSHIPGAQSLPLPQLMMDMAELPTDKELIFYCRSGGRSAAAAVMVAEEEAGLHEIYNLEGGILAWEGTLVADMPRVAIFGHQSTAEMMSTAMNLEKGALRFYFHVQSAFKDHSWSEIFGKLGHMETAHARTVYGFWRRVDNHLEPFETLFARLSGEILEGGRTLDDALRDIERQTAPSCMGLIEMALEMEYSAYDLYRTMAGQSFEPEAAEAFMTLAQAEKGHMRALAQAIETCG